MTSDAADLTALFTRFLALSDSPEGGAVLTGLLHPRATVFVEGEARALGELSAYADAFRAGFAAFAASHPGKPRRPQIEAPTLLGHHHDGDRSIAWWEARERAEGTPLTIATGFARLDGAWRLEWATLADAPGEWTYADGLAHVLADHEYAHAHPDPTPRSWLDLAFYRLFGHEKPAIATLPDARFSCGMSSVCCSIDYRITVRPAAQAFLDAAAAAGVRPEGGETRLAPWSDDRLLLKDMGEACRYLDEHRHCRLHKAFGRPVFDACTQFPLQFANTPDGVVVAGSPLCGAVRGNFGPPLGDRQAELQSRLAVRGLSNMAVPASFRLVGNHAVPWEVFRAVEATLLEALDRHDLPLRRRLWLGSRLIAAVAAGEPPALVPAWESEPLTSPADADAAQARMTLELLAMGFELGAPAGMYGAKETANSLPVGWIAVALRNMLFSKAYSYPFSLATAHHVNVAVLLMLEALAEHLGDAPVPETMVINLVTRTFQGQLQAFLDRDERIAAQFDSVWLGAAWLAAAEAEAVSR